MAYLGENIKKLGFGLMRLPQKNGASDVEETKKMVDLFLEAGCTYFDTAWVYGDSEDTIRQALVERYPRNSYLLASKLAAWADCKTREEAISQFETSLRRTGAGYFDFYLLHNLGEGRTKVFEELDIWGFAREQKEKGLIRHLGFSFHSTPEELEEIITKHPEAEFVQLQINYADWESLTVQSRRCYEVARAHGLPVVIMEPVKGGLLADPPQPVKEVLKGADEKASCASWAIRYAASLEGVITVLSGMSTVEQMEDNLSYMKDFAGFTQEQKETMEKAQEALSKIYLVPCTGCNYCAKVCPMGVGVSGTFTSINIYYLYGNEKKARSEEDWQVQGRGLKRAGDCIKCGKCESVCPQHIHIREELEKAAKVFG